MSEVETRQRTIIVAVADDVEMCRLAVEYGCSLAEVYRRATALYLLTQARVATFDVWPGATPDSPAEVTWSGEGD